MADLTYQTDIALKQGGDAFLFFGEEVTATAAQAAFANLALKQAVSVIANSGGAGSGVLSVVNIPNVGIVIYSLAAAASNASALLGSCVAGDEKILIFRTTGAAASVIISTLTASILIRGFLSEGNLSSIRAHGSAASNPMIKFLGIGTDSWAVVDTKGYVIMRPDA
jgi:hypothetical protein